MGQIQFSPNSNLEYLSFIIRCFPAYFEWIKSEHFSPFDQDETNRIFLIGASIGIRIESMECRDVLCGVEQVAAVLSSKRYGSDFFSNLVSSLKTVIKDIEEKNVSRELSLQQIFDNVT